MEILEGFNDRAQEERHQVNPRYYMVILYCKKRDLNGIRGRDLLTQVLDNEIVFQNLLQIHFRLGRDSCVLGQIQMCFSMSMAFGTPSFFLHVFFSPRKLTLQHHKSKKIQVGMECSIHLYLPKHDKDLVSPQHPCKVILLQIFRTSYEQNVICSLHIQLRKH